MFCVCFALDASFQKAFVDLTDVEFNFFVLLSNLLIIVILGEIFSNQIFI